MFQFSKTFFCALLITKRLETKQKQNKNQARIRKSWIFPTSVYEEIQTLLLEAASIWKRVFLPAT